MKKLKELISELSMAVGAGMSTLPSAQGNPIAGHDTIMSKKPLRRTPQRFAGKAVFKVNTDVFQKALYGKKKFKHYKTYVGEDEIGEDIRAFANENKDEPILLQNEKTGEMIFFKYGSK